MKLKILKKSIKTIILFIIIIIILIIITQIPHSKKGNNLSTKLNRKNNLEYKQPPKLDRKYITDPNSIYSIDSASRFINKGSDLSKTSEKFDLPFPTEASIDSPLIIGTDKMEDDQVQWIFSLKEYSTNRLVSQGFYITQMDDRDKYTKIRTKWNINKKIEKNKNYYITLSLKSAWGANKYKNSISSGIHNLNSTEWHGIGDSDKLFINDKTIVEYGKFKDLLFDKKTNSNLKNKNIILKDLTFSWYFGGAKKETLSGALKNFFSFGLAKDRYVIPIFSLNKKKRWNANYILKGNVTYLSQIEIEEALKNIFTIHINSTQEKNLKNNGSFWLNKSNPPQLSIGLNNDLFKAYEEKKWGNELDAKISATSSYSSSIKQDIKAAIEEGKINSDNWKNVQNEINNGSFNKNELENPSWTIFLSNKGPKINNQNIIDWLVAKKQIGYYSEVSKKKENYELLSLYLNNSKNINLKLYKEYGSKQIPFIIPINNTNLLEAKIPLENESQETFKPSIIIDGYNFEYKNSNIHSNNITSIKPKVYEDLGKYGINYNNTNYTYKAFYQPNTINIDSGVWFYPIGDNTRKYNSELKQIDHNQEVVDLKNNSFIKYLLNIAKNKLSKSIEDINEFDTNFPKDLKNFFFTKDGKKFKIKAFQKINNKYLAVGNIHMNNQLQNFILLLNTPVNDNVNSINFKSVLPIVRNYINQKTYSISGKTPALTSKLPFGVTTKPYEYQANQTLTKQEYDSLSSYLKSKFILSKIIVSGSTIDQYYSDIPKGINAKYKYFINGEYTGLSKPLLPNGVRIIKTISEPKTRNISIKHDGTMYHRGGNFTYGTESSELRKWKNSNPNAYDLVRGKTRRNYYGNSWAHENNYSTTYSYKNRNEKTYLINGVYLGNDTPDIPHGVFVDKKVTNLSGKTKNINWRAPSGIVKKPYEYQSNKTLTKQEYDSLPPNLKSKFEVFKNKWHGINITIADASLLPTGISHQDDSWNIKIDSSTNNLLPSLNDYVVYSNELKWIDKPITKIIKRDNKTLKRAYSSFIYEIKNKKNNIEKRSFYKPKIPVDKKNPYDLTTWVLSSDKTTTLNEFLNRSSVGAKYRTFNYKNVTYVVNNNLIMIINPYKSKSTFNNTKYYDNEDVWKIKKVVDIKDGKEEVLGDFSNQRLSSTFNKAFSMTRTGHPKTDGLLTNGNHNISVDMENFRGGNKNYKILIDTTDPVPTYQNISETNDKLYFKENKKLYDFYTSTKQIQLNWIENGIKSADVSWVDSNGNWYRKPIDISNIKDGEDFKQQINLTVDYQGLYKIEYVDIAGNYKKDFLWIQKKEKNNKNYIAYGEYPENLLIADTIYNNKRAIWFDSQNKKDLIIKNVLAGEIEVKIFNKKSGRMEIIKTPPWIKYNKQNLKSIGSTINSGQKTFSLAGDELTPLINSDPSITKSKSTNKFKEANIKIPYNSYVEFKIKTNIFYQDKKNNFQPFYSYINVLNSNKYDFIKYKKFNSKTFEVTEAIGIGNKETDNLFIPSQKENSKIVATLKDGWVKVPTKFDTKIIKDFANKVKVNYSKLYYNWYNEIKHLKNEEIFLNKEGKYKIEVIDKNNHKTIYKFIVFDYPRNFSKYIINTSQTENKKDENGKTIIKKVIKTKEFYKQPAIASIQDKSIYRLKGTFKNGFNSKLPKWTEGLNLKTKSYDYDFRVKKVAKNLNELKNWLKEDLKNSWISIDSTTKQTVIKDKSGKSIHLLEFIIYGKGKSTRLLNEFNYRSINYEVDDKKDFIGTPQGIPSNIKITQLKNSSTKLNDQQLKETAYWEGKYIDVYEESNRIPELLIDDDNDKTTPKVHLYEDYDHYQNYLAEWLASGGTKEDFFKSKSDPFGGAGGKENIIKSIIKEKMKKEKLTSQEVLSNNAELSQTKIRKNNQKNKKENQKNNSNSGGKKIGIIFGGLFGGLGTIGIVSFVLYKRYKKGFGRIKIPKKGSD